MDNNNNSYTMVVGMYAPHPHQCPQNSLHQDGNHTNVIPLSTIIACQSKADGWICPDCRYHQGNLKCDKNMFISFVGCYTKGCWGFKDKSKDI
jgi:hypothetical protein